MEEKTKYTEDDGLIYDIEGDWIPKSNGGDKIIYFENAKRSSLYRIINFNNQTVSFSDIGRVVVIRDINKHLVKEDDNEANLKRLLPIVNRMADTVMPISMPYHPQRLYCYIESFPGFDKNFEDTVGILYFREEESDNMLPVKKFFREWPIAANNKWEEISFEEYNHYKSKWMRREEENDNSDTVCRTNEKKEGGTE